MEAKIKPKYKIVGINNVGTIGSILKVVETKIPANKGYFIVGDIFEIVPGAILAFVTTNVGVVNGNETITLKKADGTNWKASDITTSSKIKHQISGSYIFENNLFNTVLPIE